MNEPLTFVITILVLAVLAFISVATKKLTVSAGLTGWLIASVMYAGSGFAGIAMMAAFFIMGTAATAHRFKTKQQLHLAESNKGRRTSGQVIANAGAAALSALLMILFPSKENVWMLMIAAGFASAAADTLSSELGNVYGKRFYNMLTLKRDTRGLDGVISLEGTAAGIAGSSLIACIYLMNVHNGLQALWVIVSGTFGNLFDSLLGATLERRNYLTNNQVNFMNTLAGMAAALLLFFISS